MASPFKPTRPYPLPANPEIVERDGKPHVRLKERGTSVLYPVSERGTQYLKPAAKWAADVRLADGRRKRVRFSPNRDASAVMLADLLKKIENEKAGVVDRFADHRKRPPHRTPQRLGKISRGERAQRGVHHSETDPGAQRI